MNEAVAAKADPNRRRTSAITTAEGSRPGAFGVVEWLLFAGVGVIWGSSFLLIETALEALHPGVIVWGRLVIGAATLACVPAARRLPSLPRADRARLGLLAVAWMAFPLTLLPLAQQWLDSALTGVLNGAMPLFAAAIATLLLRRLPGRWQVIGLAIGFGGVLTISLPEATAVEGSVTGVVLVLVAMASYGLAANVVVPLQQRYGALPVLLRAGALAALLTTPYGLWGLAQSEFEWKPVLAIVALGMFGTGLAYVLAATLNGRAGPTRGPAAVYLIPVVALLEGVLILDETVQAATLAGTVLVLGGAWLTSRAERA